MGLMMNDQTMVERVAKAIERTATGSEDGWENRTEEARSAIIAMRELTPAMEAEGALAFNDDGQVATYAWHMMVDAALR